MPTVNNQAAAEALFKKVEKYVRSFKGIHFGEIQMDLVGDKYPKYCITIETSEPMSVSDMAHDIISKDKRAIWQGNQPHEGHYDWASGVYFKPAILVYFKF